MKKLLSLLMVLAIASSLIMQMSAVEGIMNGDLTYEEGASPYVPTPEDELRRHEIFNAPMPAATVYSEALNVTAFLQSESFYCVPATVKQTLHYINGSSLTQGDYADDLGTTTAGTDMTRIASVLNSYQSDHTYTYSSFSTVLQWLLLARSALEDNVPAVLDINTTSISSWPYTTTGHFVNLSGLTYDNDNDGPGLNVALITDPYGPGFGNTWYPLTTVFNANHNHFRSAIIH